jgi:hypothetical protein
VNLPDMAASNTLVSLAASVPTTPRSGPGLNGSGMPEAKRPRLMQMPDPPATPPQPLFSIPRTFPVEHRSDASEQPQDDIQSEILLMRRLEHDEKMSNLKLQRKNASLEKKVMKQRLRNLKAENKSARLRTAILKLEKQKLLAELKSKSD